MRHMDVEFCERNQKRRKRHCFSGAGISKITNEIDNIFKQPSKAMAVIKVGSNDVERLNVAEFMNKYKELIKKLKTKVQEITIIGMLPRRFAGRKFFHNAPYLNKKLQDLSQDENIGFANFWNNFMYENHLYGRDGVHLNQVGNARLGRLLDDAVKAENHPRNKPSGN